MAGRSLYGAHQDPMGSWCHSHYDLDVTAKPASAHSGAYGITGTTPGSCQNQRQVQADATPFQTRCPQVESEQSLSGSRFTGTTPNLTDVLRR